MLKTLCDDPSLLLFLLLIYFFDLLTDKSKFKLF